MALLCFVPTNQMWVPTGEGQVSLCCVDLVAMLVTSVLTLAGRLYRLATRANS